MSRLGILPYGDAILDRLVHNAYRIELSGPSMRPGRAELSTDEKAKNKDVSEDIPVIHTIHKPTHQQQGRIDERLYLPSVTDAT